MQNVGARFDKAGIITLSRAQIYVTHTQAHQHTQPRATRTYNLHPPPPTHTQTGFSLYQEEFKVKNRSGILYRLMLLFQLIYT